MRDDVERRGVGAVPGIRVIGEPRNERGTLGDLVGNLAVRALVLLQEVQGGARGRDVTLCVESEGGPERVAAEEPGEPGPLALARGPEAGQQPGAQRRARGQPLVDADLRPRERGVQAAVRSRHLRRALLERVVIRHVLSVERGDRSEQAVVVGPCLVLSVHASHEEDRHQVRGHALARDVDHEAQREVLRLLLVGHHRRVARVGRADERDEPLAFLGDRVDVGLLVPAHVARHQPRRPHQPQPGPERARDRHGQRAVHVEQHHRRRLLEGSEERLPHRERGVRVREHGGLGPHLDPRHRVGPFDVERVSLEPEREPEVVGELQRIGPRLDPAVLVAEEGGAPADHVEERARPDRTLQLQPALRHGKAGHLRRGRLGRGQRWRESQSCERRRIHFAGASGGSGGCAASTPQFRREDEDARRQPEGFRAWTGHRARD